MKYTNIIYQIAVIALLGFIAYTANDIKEYGLTVYVQQ